MCGAVLQDWARRQFPPHVLTQSPDRDYRMREKGCRCDTVGRTLMVIRNLGWLRTYLSLASIVVLGAASAVANEDVMTLSADPANNVMPNINYSGQNYSELDQVNL